jgi:hypothetical protein
MVIGQIWVLDVDRPMLRQNSVLNEGYPPTFVMGIGYERMQNCYSVISAAVAGLIEHVVDVVDKLGAEDVV